MRASISLFMRAFVGVAVVVGLPAWFVISTANSGLDAMRLLAREAKLCADIACEEGMVLAFAAAQQHTGASQFRLRYCLGLGRYQAPAGVRRGGWIIGLFNEVAAIPCYSLTEAAPENSP
jgi:hypothetical protein